MITRRATEDLLVDLPLARFRRRPPVSARPVGFRRDLRRSSAPTPPAAAGLLFQAAEFGPAGP